MSATRPIKSIKVGRRHRKDLGDLGALTESLATVGLLHPIVINSTNRLIAGARRLAAAKELGWKTIPVHVVDLERVVDGEFAENVCRKDFTLSEIAGIARELRPLVSESARKRRNGTLRRGPELPDRKNFPNGKTRDIVARYCGISGVTLGKIEAIVDAAEKNPRQFGALKEEMDATGKADKPWRRLQLELLRDQARKTARRSHGSDQNILVGDMRLLERRLEDDAVDLFFTDPPYHDVDAFERLARLAARKLKPGGLCLVYSGQMYLPEILEVMGRHLQYWWTFAVTFTGQHAAIHPRHIQNKWKPVVAYGKAPIQPPLDWLVDLLGGGGRDKSYHEWGQAESEAAYLIRHLTLPGALVVDPYCGGGTIPVACKLTGRAWLATEADTVTAALARQRVAKHAS